MITLSVIKADTGGWVGHTALHPQMIQAAEEAIGKARGSLLIDGQVNGCGDDLALIMTHEHGEGAGAIHRFAWDVFLSTTEVARHLGLYGAGQDLLSDAFSGNLRRCRPWPSDSPADGSRWPRRSSRPLLFQRERRGPAP